MDAESRWEVDFVVVLGVGGVSWRTEVAEVDTFSGGDKVLAINSC